MTIRNIIRPLLFAAAMFGGLYLTSSRANAHPPGYGYSYGGYHHGYGNYFRPGSGIYYSPVYRSNFYRPYYGGYTPVYGGNGFNFNYSNGYYGRGLNFSFGSGYNGFYRGGFHYGW